MAIRRRGGKWVADFYDAGRVRRLVTCETRADALEVEARERMKARDLRRLRVNPYITFDEYADKWIVIAGARVSAHTLDMYRASLAHFRLAFEGVKLAEVDRSALRDFLAAKVHAGDLKRSTVGRLLSVVRAMFSDAVKDEFIARNPTAGLARDLKLSTMGDEVRAMDQDELGRFLAAAREHEPFRTYAAFATYAFTGLRMGEGLGLQVGDLDLERRKVHVRHQVRKDGTIGPTKAQKSRDVDLPREVESILLALMKPEPRVVPFGGKVVSLAAGAAEPTAPGPWLLFPEIGDPPTRLATIRVEARLRAAFARTLKRAGLSADLTPHSLRHTFASNLLVRGDSLFYVSRTLGHESIKLTADLYGRWLPVGDPSVVDRFAERVLHGSKMVTRKA
jgi:integrase